MSYVSFMHLLKSFPIWILIFSVSFYIIPLESQIHAVLWSSSFWRGPVQVTCSNINLRVLFKVRWNTLRLDPVRFSMFQRMDSPQILWVFVSLFENGGEKNQNRIKPWHQQQWKPKKKNNIFSVAAWSSNCTVANRGPHAVSFLCKDTLLTCSSHPPGYQLFLFEKLFPTELEVRLYYYILNSLLFQWALKYYCCKDNNFYINLINQIFHNIELFHSLRFVFCFYCAFLWRNFFFHFLIAVNSRKTWMMIYLQERWINVSGQRTCVTLNTFS